MEAALDLDTLPLLLLFVLPGLVSMRVYRLVMPAARIDWSTAVLEGGFYSAVNYALLSWLIVLMHRGTFPADHPLGYAALSIVVLFVAPATWPFLYRWAVKKAGWVRKLQLPYPTAWDFYFDRRNPAFVLVHLKNGRHIGGYFGPDSYATSHPTSGDLYVQAVYQTDDDGKFVGPVDSTDGLLIRCDEYRYVELFRVPDQTAGPDSTPSDSKPSATDA